MPNTTRSLPKQLLTTFVLEFQDKDKNKPLSYVRVRVDMLDKNDKVSRRLFLGSSNAKGKVQLAIPLRNLAAGRQPELLPKVQIQVLDFDGDELLKDIVQLKTNKSLTIIKLPAKKQEIKIQAPLGNGSLVLGRKFSDNLSSLFKAHNIGTLAALRKAGPELFKDLSEQDKADVDELTAHAQLQLLSRDHKNNQSLIKAGYSSIIDIIGRPYNTFISKMKGSVSEETANQLYIAAVDKMNLINIMYFSMAADSANGIDESNSEPFCECNCGSAVSPQAYLVDLLDYAVDNLYYEGNPIDISRLERTFGQPFGSLPVDCEYASQLVRQVRLCIEVLHTRNRLLNNNDIKKAVSNALLAYMPKAYKSLLRSLGTSYEELREVRSNEEARIRLGERLGIEPDQVDILRLEAGGSQRKRLDEANLERLFGLQATARDPLAPVAQPEWIAQRKAFLRMLWKKFDHPAREGDILMVDPDIVDESELMQPHSSNPAYILWGERKDDLQNRLGALGALNSVTAMVEDEFGAPIDLPEWEAVATKLQSADSSEVEEGKNELMRINKHLLQETFSYLFLIARRENSGEEIKPQERQQALDVLINIYKLKRFNDWSDEETNKNIKLSPPFFALTEKEPNLNPLRASDEVRGKWRAELERNSTTPLIDPDIISESNFAPGNNSATAYEMWTGRRALLGDGRSTDDDNRIEGRLFTAIASINTVSKLDAVLTNSDLRAEESPNILFHHIGFTAPELQKIDDALNKGTALSIKPEQYGLSVAELRSLFEVRRLADNADSDDWNLVHHILVQAEKRRYLYPQWLTEEEDKEIFLNPDIFHLPSDTLVNILPELRLASGFLQYRRNSRRQREWRDQLKARIEQEAVILTELQSAIDAAESATLPSLRDDLVMATVSSNVGGESLEERKRWVMNQLLINAFENACRKTTRIAQAIETIQLMLWGINNGQFEDNKYSLEASRAENFTAEWTWLGSYATWRSAMFTYLYPENLLLPQLRSTIDGQPNPNTDPTKLFEAILKIISGQVTQSLSAESEGNNGSDEAPAAEDEELNRLINFIYSYLGNQQDFQAIENQKKIFNYLFSWRIYIADLWMVTDPTIYVPPNQPADALVNPYYAVPESRHFSYSGMMFAWYEYVTESAFLEDVLYIPLAFALAQHKRGNFEAALYWFRVICNFEAKVSDDSQGWTNFRLDLYFQQRSTDNYSALDSWLNDALNPHRIAATRTNADIRFVLLSTIRCLLDYADSEFSKDTTESLARARELYETARRLLESKHLGKELADCRDLASLISEIGEGHYTEVLLPELDLLASMSRGGLSKNARDSLRKELKDVFQNFDPLKPRNKLQREVHKIVDRHISYKPIEKLEQVYVSGKKDLINVYQRTISDPLFFSIVQRTGKTGTSLAAIREVGKPGRHWIPPSKEFQFCVPHNPLISILRLRYEVSWFKINNCMNFADQHREVPSYAAPTDTYSGMPVADVGSTVGLSAAARFVPTFYRYRTLIERAKQLVNMAQQMEATYLSFLEKRDQEAYSIMRARQDLGIANANVELQDLRVTEAGYGQELAAYQRDRADYTFKHYDDLLESGLLQSEKDAQFYMGANVVLQGAVALITTGGAIVAGLAAGGLLGTLSTGVGGFFAALTGASGAAAAAMSLSQTAFSSTSGALSSASSFYSMAASFERREQEWTFQRILADVDKNIAEIQKKSAQSRYEIVVKEKRISEMSAENANDVVNFLNTKFTSTELYAWMGGIIGGIYRYLLQEATTIAKLAQHQLAFERQETELAMILDDYWIYTDTSAILRRGDSSEDRRGMTGSARLLQDITRLDQEAFLTDRRKLQVSKTFSLALLDPVAFARFQESGVLPFSTKLEQFDRDFPGHYLRLIKRVRVSVIALVPPTEGIRASLSSSGITRVVRNGNTFTETEIRRDPESVSFTSPINATGLFELQEQAEMLLPFEGNGVAGSWTFSMPRPANVIDYGTIADVFVTLEYTALESLIYRDQVIQRLDRSVSSECPFSFRRHFSDSWYDLHHPDLVRDPQQPIAISFQTRREDFPPNISDLKIEHVTLYFNSRSGAPIKIDVKHLRFTEKGQGGAVGGAASTTNGLISTRGGQFWGGVINKSPIGTWELAFDPDNDEMLALFNNEEEGDSIADILFVITYGGITPPWPN